MQLKSFLSTAAAVLIGLAVVTGAQADGHVKNKRVLTLDLAKKIADGCEAHYAKQTDWRPLNIAVVDDGGNLKVFRRIERHLQHGSIAELAFGKDGQPGRVPGIADIPGVAAFPGGLPIMTSDGQHIGAIGVSGATGDQDEECAQAGLDAVKGML